MQSKKKLRVPKKLSSLQRTSIPESTEKTDIKEETRENESSSSDCEHSLSQGPEKFKDYEIKEPNEEKEETMEESTKSGTCSYDASTYNQREQSTGIPVKRKRTSESSISRGGNISSDVPSNISRYEGEKKSNIDSIKKNYVTEVDASGLEGFWLTIEFCVEKDFLLFLNLCTALKLKELLLYLLTVMKRKIPFVICSSGWGHKKGLDFIYTHLEIIRSKSKEIDICIRACTQYQSRLVVISFPHGYVKIQDYIPTLTGKHTTRPTVEDIQREEQRIKQITEED